MAFISEIHYQNTYSNNSGVAEYVEVALTTAEVEAMQAGDLTFTISTYEQNGSLAQVFVLDPDDVVVDPVTGVPTILVPAALSGPAATSEPEAVALTRSEGGGPEQVISFYDIAPANGTIEADGGPANGATAELLPASNNGQSIQFDRAGNRIDGKVTPNQAVCFAAGTRIETASGEVAIEDLSAGAMVRTRDHGLQRLSWIGRQHLDDAALHRAPHLRPVRIRAGSLGDGLPSRDLVVSPQHRILVNSKIAQRMFGAAEVLVAAKQLCGIGGIGIDMQARGVTYYHMLFRRHEIVFSNGAETESLFTGPEALASVGTAARDEIAALFPEITRPDFNPRPARPLVPGARGRRLAARHVRNSRPLLMS
ncbi:Hint domain-containing protein [Paracoccus isoporae]|uniref:Hint domain-containing protein n=1 Tax=Paracoccus isoporae TaxID=591205 RepID=A0A1G7EUV0_9RHOB|nr:Hint domain-containing protein [Paracoccus isoporae]SDE67215.1 Hint domain-containing protein [Paracoccus isoporae]